MSEWCWTVQPFCDRVAKCKVSAVDARDRYGFRKELRFDTERDAWQFVVNRNREKIAALEKDIALTRKKLLKAADRYQRASAEGS